VLRSLAQLAGPFEARVVAEGVEEPAELDALEALGIRFVQGYLFARPVPAAEIAAVTRLRGGRTRRPSSLAKVQARR
jgi:EAL domain-containing protein (putative c-di-GMP-specific phosphodiesterase class I)